MRRLFPILIVSAWALFFPALDAAGEATGKATGKATGEAAREAAREAAAQQTQGPGLPVRVEDVMLTDLNKNPTGLADLGKKHMMIFYVDPDAHRQNRKFQAEIEARQSELYSPDIQAYAIINLKDTILPNALVRAIAERRTRGQPSVNLADADRALAAAWGLGDCNGKFCVLFVTRECEMVYFRAGVFTDQDVADFYSTVAKYQ